MLLGTRDRQAPSQPSTGIVNTDDSLALFPDGKHRLRRTPGLAARRHRRRNAAGRVRILDAADGQELRESRCPPTRSCRSTRPTPSASVALSSDGKTLAGVGSDSWVYLWDMTTGKEWAASRPSCPSFVAFSPDGKTLAVGTWGNAIHVYDAASGKELPRGTARASQAFSAGLTPDGKTLATPEGTRSLALWDPATGELRGALDGHEGPATGVSSPPTAARSSPSAATAPCVSGTWRPVVNGDEFDRENIGVWPQRAGLLVRRQAARGTGMRHRTAFRSSLIDARTGKRVREIDAASPAVHGRLSCRTADRWSSGPATAKPVWDVSTGKTTREVEYPEAVKSRPGPVAVAGGPEASFFTAAVSSDGRRIAFGSANDLIAIHELAGGAELCRTRN